MQKYHMIAVDQRGFRESTYHYHCHFFADWAADIVEFMKLKK